MSWRQRILVLDAVSNRLAPAIIMLLAVVFCCGPVAGRLAEETGRGGPADEELLLRYYLQAGDFAQLTQMLHAESEFDSVRWERDAIWCRLAGSQQVVRAENPRCADYRTLFKQLGADSARITDGRIELPMWCHAGWLRSPGYCKGYVYTGDRAPDGAEHARYSRHIEGSWYIITQ